MANRRLVRAKRIWIAAIAAAAVAVSAGLAAAQDMAPAEEELPAEQAPAPSQQPRMEADISAELLENGFTHLYELKFTQARQEFLAYQKARPEDPLGKAAEAASYLFEEFHAKGVLTSAFFLNDDRFLGGIEGSPGENRNQAFVAANHAAREMAKKSVKANPHDPHGLLVLTMTDGLESNYAAMIEKKQLQALSFMRQAESEANALLAVDPDAKDAYVALGMANYVIGCLPGYKKAFLWFGGVHGDRNRGIQQMKSAAEQGHYLRPFAKILLALAYEREHQGEHAHPLLADLCAQFPSNPIFARELALLEDNPCCSKR
ncbi:MAG TPA: hypothetical protein VEG64_15790 [Candidatus Sulfotelmatobacter sp.]|nr:hypothetical protein [Candidatus Sulfotelmatobacter sp.]